MSELPIKRSEQINELVAALAAAQTEFEPIQKNHANPFYKSRYADLADIISATQPALSKNGLVVIQIPLQNRETQEAGAFSMLAHKSGQFISSELLLPTKEGKYDAQGAGSAITYAKRYTWPSLIGVAAEDDDDGNAAAGHSSQTSSQTEQVAKPKTVKAPPVSQKVSSQGGERPNDSKPVQNKPVVTPTPQQSAPQTNDPAPTVPEQGSVVPVSVSEPTNSPTETAPTSVESVVSALKDFSNTLKSSEKPTKAQFDVYTARAVALKVPLEKAGLKPSKGLQTGAKLKKYLLEIAGAKELTDLVIYQWEDFFLHADQTEHVQLVNLINTSIEGGKAA